jgi:acylphosphatase
MVGFALRVTGRVQGVGYRYFCKTKAESMRINGWVKNTDDGFVELMISGSEENVKSFINLIKKPLHGHVEEVVIEKSDVTFKHFEIK